jgi:hypothetical protein
MVEISVVLSFHNDNCDDLVFLDVMPCGLLEVYCPSEE